MSTALLDHAQHVLTANPDVARSLSNYAREINVPMEHVVLGILQMVAEEYDHATGNGTIPCLF